MYLTASTWSKVSINSRILVMLPAIRSPIVSAHVRSSASAEARSNLAWNDGEGASKGLSWQGKRHGSMRIVRCTRQAVTNLGRSELVPLRSRSSFALVPRWGAELEPRGTTAARDIDIWFDPV